MDNEMSTKKRVRAIERRVKCESRPSRYYLGIYEFIDEGGAVIRVRAESKRDAARQIEFSQR